MFGEGATVHMKIVDNATAQELVDANTAIVATRPTHERLARNCFPGAREETARYATMKPGVCALHLHYRGPPIPDSGAMPIGGMVNFYLIDVDDYQQDETGVTRRNRTFIGATLRFPIDILVLQPPKPKGQW